MDIRIEALPGSDPVVGPKGVMDLEIIFLNPPSTSPTHVHTLTLTAVCLVIYPTVKYVSGAWAFRFTLV